jgi:type IV secretory pathway VirB9-like protein
MRYWILLGLPLLAGCASGPTWVPQPSHLPVALGESLITEEPPVDELVDLMATGTAVPAKASGKVVGAMLVYPKSVASVYPITTRVNHTTTLIWPIGEELRGDITGGNERVLFKPAPEAEAVEADAWLLAKGYSGEGPTKRLQVDVTPRVAKLHTTIVVRTNRGSYVLEATSTEKTYQPMVAFWSNAARPEVTQQKPLVQTTGMLGVSYEILTADGQAPSWTPVAVWDTQALTLFHFSQGLPQGEAPELYSVTPDGLRALVNTTPAGQRTLIAHRLSRAWELKLGATVVRVRQTPGYAAISCPESAGCPRVASQR